YFRQRHPSRKWKTCENCTVIVKDKKVPNGQQEFVDAIEQPTISEMFHHAARQNVCQKNPLIMLW
ncbi:36014_t:CDS:2, partial [Gigaspora margarita]